MAANIGIDLSKATSAQLEAMKNEVLKRLAERAQVSDIEGSASLLYDRHGSGHSRATPPKFQAAEQPVL